MKLAVLFYVILLFCTGCGPHTEPVSPTAILFSDVTIVDVTDGSLHEKMQVVVDSGKIRSITNEVENPESFSHKVDGSGKYLMPGLAEMHAHIPSPPTTIERQEETLFLYLSNGITTIRGMLGHPSHLELREKVREGKVLGPRIFTSSPSLNGNSVNSANAGDSLVKTYAAEGYDFLKIHPGISLTPFDTLAATANEVNIEFAGHVPVDVGIRHALESGYASIDHVDGFLEGLVPESAGVKPDENGFFGYNFTPLADTTLIAGLVDLSRQNKVWIVPTQSLFERWFAPVDAESLLKQPEMQYMPASTLEEWRQRKLETTGPGTGFEVGQWEKFIAIRRQLIKALQEKGHGMLLGSDAPQLFNVPGFSIHHEIAAMEKAGLSPLQILQSGTVNPALYFGREGEFGLVEEGLSADLILVDANPLEDLQALKQISGVMVFGRWLDRETLDEKLAEIAAHAGSQ
jgi:imidazolonepropionase-like amidohydrolase